MIKNRNFKTNPSLRLARTAKRVSCRRFFCVSYPSRRKDKIWSRNNKRSLKNFARQELKEEVDRELEERVWWSYTPSELNKYWNKEWSRNINQPRRINGL